MLTPKIHWRKLLKKEPVSMTVTEHLESVVLNLATMIRQLNILRHLFHQAMASYMTLILIPISILPRLII